jgi:RimJ/RimL family protein N-acetyltransferase
MPTEPERIEIRGPRVLLRAYRPEEMEPLLERWLSSRWRVGPQSDRATMRRRLKRRIERSGRFADGRLEFAIDVEGEVIGDVEGRHPPGSMPPGVYEIGIEIYREGRRGNGYGSEAVELITGHLFEAHDAGRVQASTAVWNAPMRRVLENLGYIEEGVLRGFMPTEGGRDDYVMYGVTRDDWRSHGGTPGSPVGPLLHGAGSGSD